MIEKSEIENAWVNLCVRWDVDQHYWYPLRQADSMPDDVLAFYDPFFERFVGHKKICGILSGRGISRILELREGGDGEETTTAGLEFYYNGLEGYWTSEPFDWLIYASHENSITFAGDWLISDIKQIWPNWKKCVYISPFEEDYISDDKTSF